MAREFLERVHVEDPDFALTYANQPITREAREQAADSLKR